MNVDLGILLGVLGLMVGSLPLIASASTRFRFAIQRILGRRDLIGQLLQELSRSGFRAKYPSKFAKWLSGPRYYYRQEDGVDGPRSRFFLFFIRQDIELQQFKAVLIPPLDFGHGLGKEERDESLLGMRFDEDWQRYLSGIGRKARNAKDRRAGWTEGLLFRKKRPFEARRIILVDRRILDLLIFETDWVIESSRVPIGSQGGLIGEVSRGIIEYSKTVLLIHRLADTYKDAIATLYVDRSQVASDEYYDFGLYRINGVPIVYNPIYEKQQSKRVVREKVSIGISKRQLFGIGEYEEDFDLLWDRVEPQCDQQDNLLKLKHLPDDYFTSQNSQYFSDFNAYSLDFFDRGYGDQLSEIYFKKLRLASNLEAALSGEL